MLCAIHQPQYLPWLGYLSKLDAADIIVIYDDTQYKHDEWQNRNRILSPTGGCQWLTVPVHHSQDQLIRDIRIDNTKHWPRKHIHAIQTIYGRAPVFPLYQQEIEELLHRDWQRLADLNMAVIQLLFRWFGIDRKIVFSSGLQYQGRATDALVSMCKAVGADAYLSGPGGREYLETDQFGSAGIQLLFHDYDHPVYPQHGTGQFVPGLAAIDLLFNCGQESAAILRSGRRITAHTNGETHERPCNRVAS